MGAVFSRLRPTRTILTVVPRQDTVAAPAVLRVEEVSPTAISGREAASTTTAESLTTPYSSASVPLASPPDPRPRVVSSAFPSYLHQELSTLLGDESTSLDVCPDKWPSEALTRWVTVVPHEEIKSAQLNSHRLLALRSPENDILGIRSSSYRIPHGIICYLYGLAVDEDFLISSEYPGGIEFGRSYYASSTAAILREGVTVTLTTARKSHRYRVVPSLYCPITSMRKYHPDCPIDNCHCTSTLPNCCIRPLMPVPTTELYTSRMCFAVFLLDGCNPNPNDELILDPELRPFPPHASL